MSWFNSDAIKSIASQVSTFAENALTLDDQEQDQEQDSSNSFIHELQQEISRLSEANKRLQQENSKWQELQDSNSYQERLHLLENKLDQAGTYIKQLSIENSNLMANVDEKEIEISLLNQRLTDLPPTLINNNKKEEEIQELNRKWEEIVNQKQVEIEQLGLELKELTLSLATFDANNNTTSHTTMDANTNTYTTELELELKEYKSQVQQLTNANTTLGKQISNLTNSLSKFNQESQDQFQEISSDYESKSRQTLLEFELEKNKLIESHQEELGEIIDNFEKARVNEANQVELERSQLHNQIQALQEQLMHLKDSQVSQDAKKQEFQDLIQILKACSTTSLNVESIPQPLVEPILELNQLINDLKVKTSEQESELSQLQVQFEDQVQECIDLQSQLVDLEESQSVSVSNKFISTTKVDEYQEKINHMTLENKEYQQNQEKMTLEMEKRVLEIQNLKSQVECHTNMNLEFQKERQEWNNQQEAMKSAIIAKLQSEMDEKESLQHHIETLVQQESLLKNKITELEAQSSSSDKLVKEISRLQSHLMEIENVHSQEVLELENTIAGLKFNLSESSREQEIFHDALEVERVAASEAQEAMKEIHQDLLNCQREKETLVQKSKEDAICIHNLQNVLSELQSVKESEFQIALDKIQSELKEQLSLTMEYKTRALSAEQNLADLNLNKTSIQELQSQVNDRNGLIGKLKHDILQLQSHLSEAMKRLKSGSDDEFVDRKLITNLFVQFLSLSQGDGKKYEILQIISSILNLSLADQGKIGLFKPSNVVNEQSQSAPTTFTDMWITFLYKEAGILDQQVSPTHSNSSLSNPIEPRVESVPDATTPSL